MTPNAPRKTIWQAWTGFWFTPADPTPLALMRVLTGLLVLYTHLAYSFDLQAFFGRNGWYDLESVNKERKEYPTVLAPFDTFDEAVRSAYLPEFPHRRAAVMAFVRGLPADKPTRVAGLRYVFRLQATNNVTDAQEGLLYLSKLSAAPDVRKAQLDAVEDESLRQAGRDYTPDALAKMPTAARKDARGEIEALLKLLPADDSQRVFVVAHLTEMDFGMRKLFADFLADLPDDPVERTKVLDYLEYWNNEAKKAYSLGNPLFSLWFHVTDPTEMAVAHGVILVVIFLFTIGLWTRVTSVLTWLAVVGYIHRSQQVLFGMDTMMNILLIYLMVGNSGAAYSVDRLIARYRAAKHSLGKSGTLDAATKAYLALPPASASAAFALRLVQVHFCFIYMASGLSKLKGAAWWTHVAFWDTLVNPEFTLVQFQWYEWLVRTMVESRPVFSFMCAGGVAFTFIMEIGLPFLVWTRARPYIVILGCLFHFGIAACMGLNLFGLLMMTMLLSYLPATAIRAAFNGSPGSRPTLRLRGKEPAHQEAAAVLLALDNGRLELAEAKAGDGLSVVENGQPVPVSKLLGAWRWVPGLMKRARG